MKRFIALLLVLITVLSVCSCASNLTTEEPEETKTEAKTEAKTEKKTEAKTEAKTEEKTEAKTEPKTKEKKLPPVQDLPNIMLTEDKLPQRLESSIVAFEKETIVKGQILFYGHSHYTRWTDTRSSWAPTQPLNAMVTTPKGNKPCINHGFGSSNSYDLCYYYERAVRPWEPKALVITTYLNAGSMTNDEQLECIEWLVKQVNLDFPDCKIFMTDYPPTKSLSESSQGTIDDKIALNKRCADMVKKYKNVKIIEISKDERLYTNKANAGSYKGIDLSLYWSDGVHFSVAGYELMAKIYKEALKDVLKTYDN